MPVCRSLLGASWFWHHLDFAGVKDGHAVIWVIINK
jgi:hypothetical protein